MVADRVFMENVHRIHDSLGGDTGFFDDDSLNKGYTTHTALTPTWLLDGNYHYAPYPSGPYYNWLPYPGRVEPPDPVPAEWSNLWTDGATATQDIFTAFADGIGLAYHDDHGSQDGWAYPQFTSDDAASLTNGVMLPVVLSNDCECGWYDDYDGFAEALQINPLGGAIGIIAAARVSYNGPSDTLAISFFDAFWDDIDASWTSTSPLYPTTWRPAEALNRAKVRTLYGYDFDDDSILHAQLYNYFGDPEMMLRTQTPVPLNATYAPSTMAGQSIDLDFTVTRGGVAFEGALVSVSRVGTDDHWTGTTGPGGTVTLYGVTPSEPGRYDVVVSGFNCVPFLGSFRSIRDGAPEIAVTQDGTELTDGETTPIDFGQGVHNRPGPTLTFTVYNDGSEDLTGVAIAPLPAGFTLVDGLPGTIAAGAFDTFTVQLDTSTVGAFAGEISIDSNDADEDPFNFAIAGTVVAAPQEVTVELGGVEVPDGQTAAIDLGFGVHLLPGPSLTFTVRNDGDLPLTLGGVSVPTGFLLTEPLVGVLAGGASDTFTVQLDTSTLGTFLGEVVFLNGDADENPYNFSIRGRVNPMPAEIGVQRGVTEVLDGQVAPIDFGTAFRGTIGPTITFTVRNDGELNLTLGTISLPTGFILIEGLPTTLAGGATDPFTVRLDTSAVGVYAGDISFANNDSDENPFNFPIIGEVTLRPQEITVHAGAVEVFDGDVVPVSFGTAQQGTSPGPQIAFTVSNTGDAVLSTFGVNVPAGYTVIEPLDAAIPAGASDTFTVELDTAVLGTFPGEIDIFSDDADEATFNFAVTGQIVAPQPEITVELDAVEIPDDPGGTAVDFGTGYLNRPGPILTFTIRNDGEVNLTLPADPVQVDDLVHYSLLAGPADLDLAPGESDTFSVQLLTPFLGTFPAEITIASDDADENPYNIPITGTVALMPPEITVFMGAAEIVDGEIVPIEFGTVYRTRTGPTAVFTVWNDGDSNLTLSGPVVPVGFNVIDPLVGTLAPGASDTFSIQLDTSTAGLFQGDVEIGSNDADEDPFNFAIRGQVLPLPPEVTVFYTDWGAIYEEIQDDELTPVDFGTVERDDPNPSWTFVIWNDGDQNLTAGEIQLPDHYVLTVDLWDPWWPLWPGDWDWFTVELDTSIAGTFDGEISFATNDPDENPFNFAVTGTVNGLPPEVSVSVAGAEILDGQIDPIDFGIVVAGRAGLTRVFTVTNLGDQVLTLGAVTVPTGYTLVEGLVGPLAPGASDTFSVRLDNDPEGLKAGDISFATNDPDENPFNFPITGEVTWYNLTDSHLTVYGTTGADNLTFLHDVDGYHVTLNAHLEVIFDPSEVSSLAFNGGAGADSAVVTLGSGAFSGEMNGPGARIDGPPYTIDVANTEDIQIFGGGGDDTVSLFGSAKDDVFQADPAFGQMQGPGYCNYVQGFSNVLADGGSDGYDLAVLNDSPNDDLFYGYPTHAMLTGPGFLLSATGFDRVEAYAHAGGTNDRAYLYDSPGNDRFEARPANAFLNGVGFDNYVEGFDRVHGYANNNGIDKAYLYDSPGDDTFRGYPTYATFEGAGFYYYAGSFDRVNTYANSGGANDRAYLYDSPGNDKFLGKWDRSYLRGSGFYNFVKFFDRVDAYATAGGTNDRAFLYGSAGDDTLIGKKAYSRMMGPGYKNYARWFDKVYADGRGAGNDRAYIYDAAGTDTFYGQGRIGELTGTAHYVQAKWFEHLWAKGSASGPNRMRLGTLKYILHKQGRWV